jgi:catalase
VGRMVLDRNPVNYFAEVEQVAFGTGVLVDGLDFSDDKLLQGRTFSYSDTQRHRVGTNYLQLPINAPKSPVATNQRDGQMAYLQDIAEGSNPHVNYEPSSQNNVAEAARPGTEHTPHYNAHLVRQKIPRQNNFGQAGERWHAFEDWEREELVRNLVNTLAPCKELIRRRMIELFKQCDPEYGRRVEEGLAHNQGHQQKGPIGTTRSEEGVEQASQNSQEAKPY